MTVYAKGIKLVCPKDTCTSMFITALLTTAKIWNQPVPSNERTDDKSVVCTASPSYLCTLHPWVQPTSGGKYSEKRHLFEHVRIFSSHYH
jgi:hypothetical protein